MLVRESRKLLVKQIQKPGFSVCAQEDSEHHLKFYEDLTDDTYANENWLITHGED